MGRYISYVGTREGWLYLAVILDLHSRRAIGWAVSNRMKRDLAIRALKMAVALRSPPKGCIHHTDRGGQGGFKPSSQRLVYISSQDFVQCFSGCFPARRFAGAAIWGVGNCIQFISTVLAEICAFWKVLAQQPVGIFIAPTLPRIARQAILHAKTAERGFEGHRSRYLSQYLTSVSRVAPFPPLGPKLAICADVRADVVWFW